MPLVGAERAYSRCRSRQHNRFVQSVRSELSVDPQIIAARDAARVHLRAKAASEGLEIADDDLDVADPYARPTSSKPQHPVAVQRGMPQFPQAMNRAYLDDFDNLYRQS